MNVEPLIAYTTNAGRALFARCIAQRIAPQIYRAQVGDGTIRDSETYAFLSDSAAFEARRELISPILGAQAVISGSEYEPGDPSADITVQASLGTLTQGYAYTEVGLLAKDPDGGPDVLVAYVPRYEYPAVVYPGSLSETTVIIELVGVSDVRVEVSPASVLTLDRARTHFRRLDVVIPREWVEGQVKQDEDIALLFGLLTNTIPGSTSFVISFDSVDGVEVLDGVLDRANRRIWA